MYNTPPRLENVPLPCTPALFRALFCLLIFSFVFCGTALAEPWNGDIAAGFAGGDGSFESPYQVETAAQLAYLANETNNNASFETEDVYFRLTADIDLDDKAWIPIGKEGSHNFFSGNFDGNGKNITGLNVTGDYRYAGLFGQVTGGNITNLTIDGDITVSSDNSFVYVGGIVGISNGAILDSTFTGNITVTIADSPIYIGGITGYTDDEISHCIFIGDVTANSNNSTAEIYAGGIVGKTESDIFDCTAQGDITVSNYDNGARIEVGGIVGVTSENTEVTRCCSSMTVFGWGHAIYAGGIAGKNLGDISSCSVTAEVLVVGSEYSAIEVYAGGIAGVNNPSGTISNCNINLNVEIVGSDQSRQVSAGGIAGLNYGEIESCSFSGSISADVSDTASEQISSAGGIVGNNAGIISDCHSSGTIEVDSSVQTGAAYAGGIAGYNGIYDGVAGLVDRCISSSTVSALAEGSGNVFSYAGGIVGRNDGGNITSCESSGDTNATGDFRAYAGGIAGHNQLGDIISCVSEGNTSSVAKAEDSRSYAGGIAGKNLGGEICCCNSSGLTQAEFSSVNGQAEDSKSYAGGIVGYNEYSTDAESVLPGYIANSYSNGVTLATGNYDTYAGGIAGLNDDVCWIFSCVSEGETISTAVRPDGFDYNSRSYAGGITGFNDGIIHESTSSGDTVSQGNDESVAGGIAGYNFKAEIYSSKSLGDTTAKNAGLIYVGGIAGKNTYGFVGMCSSNGDVIGETDAGQSKNYVGGVVGWNSASTEYWSESFNSTLVVNSSSTGDVIGEGHIVYVGGVVGCNSAECISAVAAIENCYAVGTVTQETTSAGNAGGIVGYNNADAGSVIIKNCYAAVDVTCTGVASYAGGIVGLNSAANSSTISVETCYATGSLICSNALSSYVGGIVGGNSAMSGEQKSTILISNCSALNEEISGVCTENTPYVAKVVGDVKEMMGELDVSLINNYAWNGMKVTGSSEKGDSGKSISSAEIWGKLFGQFTDANGWKIGSSENFKLPVLKSLAEPAEANAKHLYYTAPSSSDDDYSKPSKPVEPTVPETPSVTPTEPETPEQGVVPPAETVVEEAQGIIVTEDTTQTLPTGETVTVVSLETTEVILAVAVPENIAAENPGASVQVTEGNAESVSLPTEISAADVHRIVAVSIVDTAGNPVKVTQSGYFILDAVVPEGKKLVVGHHKDGKWVDCKVEILENGQYKVYYNGLSPFAAVFIDEHKPSPFAAEEEPTKPAESSAPILGVLAALGAVAVIRRK